MSAEGTRSLLSQVFPPHCGVTVEVVVLPAFPESPVVRVVVVVLGVGVEPDVVEVVVSGVLDVVVDGRVDVVDPFPSWRCPLLPAAEKVVVVAVALSPPPAALALLASMRAAAADVVKPAGGVPMDTDRPLSNVSTELSLPSMPRAQTPTPSKFERAAS
jgi:hypothetical protein